MSGEPGPRVVAFLCRWCGYAGADMAGMLRFQYPPRVFPIMVPCTGRIDFEWVLYALARGADGVLIAGCHTPNDCHYVSGNFKCLKRFALFRKYIRQLGIDERRVKLAWISAAEGAKFARVVREFVEVVRKLGRLCVD